jgi:hypothetical protein
VLVEVCQKNNAKADASAIAMRTTGCTEGW